MAWEPRLVAGTWTEIGTGTWTWQVGRSVGWSVGRSAGKLAGRYVASSASTTAAVDCEQTWSCDDVFLLLLSPLSTASPPPPSIPPPASGFPFFLFVLLISLFLLKHISLGFLFFVLMPVHLPTFPQPRMHLQCSRRPGLRGRVTARSLREPSLPLSSVPVEISHTGHHLYGDSKTNIDFHPSGNPFLLNFKGFSEKIVGKMISKSPYESCTEPSPLRKGVNLQMFLAEGRIPCRGHFSELVP